MDDLIYRQEAIAALGERPTLWIGSAYEVGSRNRFDMDRLAIDTVPSVDAIPVRRGKWVYETKKILVDETDDGPVYASEKYWRCTACGKPKGFWTYKPDDKFCSECGADMREEEDAVD